LLSHHVGKTPAQSRCGERDEYACDDPIHGPAFSL